MKTPISRLYLNRMLQVAGWTIYFILNVNFFYSFGILDLFPAVLRSLMLTMLYLSMFYLNYLWLISGFLNRKKCGCIS